MIMEIFAGIGVIVVMCVVAELMEHLRDTFRNWRENGCKIKLLCKPHKYEINWFWLKSGDLCLKCKKCGKTKRLYIDGDSWGKWMDRREAVRSVGLDKELLEMFLQRLYKRDVISAQKAVEASKEIEELVSDARRAPAGGIKSEIHD